MAKELKKVFVRPAPGCKVRDDQTRQLLREEGEWKPRSTYWLRRIRMVDVIEGTPGNPVKGISGSIAVNDEDLPTAKISNSKRAGKGKDSR